MKINPHTILVLLSAGLLFTCSEDKITGPSRDDFRYPLKAGNTWHYDRRLTLTFTMTSGVRPPEVEQAEVRVVVEGEEQLADSTPAFRLVEQTESGDWLNSAIYQNRADGLYIVSGSDDPSSLPKNSPDFFEMRLTQHPPADFAVYALLASPFVLFNIESDDRLALKYPLKTGTEWIYTEKNRPRRVNKKVIGEANVQTDTGTFKTVKVQWIVDFNGDGEFDDTIEYFDYIANEGLVKRSFLIKKLPVVDDEGGNIGSYSYHEESILSSYKLN